MDSSSRHASVRLSHTSKSVLVPARVLPTADDVRFQSSALSAGCVARCSRRVSGGATAAAAAAAASL